jgi:hypothetical protein
MFGIPASVAIMFFVALEAGGRSGLWPALFLSVLGLSFYFFVFYRGRHCPQCRARLTEKREYLAPSSLQYRRKLECQHCATLWDTGQTGDESCSD